MTDLGSILGRLGLGEYHDVLVGEGFDTWETVLDIQESDLTALKFKLGHRRKLQREIANYRRVSCDHSIGSPALDTVGETGRPTESPSTPTDIPERGTYGTGETKRKYRRHPKPDENAPLRPPSAYVIFSNKIREDVRGHNMSFTDIAKLVGDRWQKLAPTEKEPYETQATKAKEKYNAELTEYKKTDLYRDYLRYLAEFKAKHGGSVTDSKRPRLENRSSNGSLSAKSSEAAPETTTVPTKHASVGSVGAIGSTIPHGELGSSIPLAPYAGQGVSTRLPAMSPSTDSKVLTPAHEQRQSMALSSHSSVSDESTTVRDHPDSLRHATQLSLPPGPSPTSAEFMRMSATTRRPVCAHTSLGSESNSRSPAPSRSNVSPSEGSFMLANPGASLEEGWPAQPCEPVRASFPMSTSMPISAAAFSPLVSSERLPDVMQDQSQRILPLPTTSASLEGYHRLRPVLGISAMAAPRPRDLSGFGMGFRISVENKASLGRSESEAADALAGLAYGSRPRQLPARTGSERRR